MVTVIVMFETLGPFTKDDIERCMYSPDQVNENDVTINVFPLKPIGPKNRLIHERDYIEQRIKELDTTGIFNVSLKDNQAYYMKKYLAVLNERIRLWTLEETS